MLPAPRRGCPGAKPIVGARRRVPSGQGEGMDALAVVAWGCCCQLTDDEWGDLSDEAEQVREERGGEIARVGCQL